MREFIHEPVTNAGGTGTELRRQCAQKKRKKRLQWLVVANFDSQQSGASLHRAVDLKLLGEMFDNAAPSTTS